MVLLLILMLFGGIAIYVKDHQHCTVALSKSVSKQFKLLILKVWRSATFSLFLLLFALEYF